MKWFCIFLLAFVVSCQRNDERKVSLTGSSTVAPLARELGARFEKSNPDVRIDVQMGGSSRGLSDTRNGLAEIGMISRALKEDEADVLGHPIALDGIAVIVHRQNKVAELTKDQVLGIYNGTIENWHRVGGDDAPITVVNKAEGRSTLELFCKHFGLKNKEIKADVIIGDNEQGIQTVSGNPNAIGYVSVGTAEYDVEKGVQIKLVKMDGVVASRATVRDGTFPISRPLTLVTKSEPRGLAKQFIEFAQSKENHDLIEGQFFVPLGP